MRIDDGDGSPKTELSADFRQLCRGGNLASSPCRWRSLCCGKGGARTRTTTTAGRKRPRSDEGGPTRDEDYENNESDGGGESSPSSCPGGENWLCLECGAVLCSRYGNGHAKLHQEGAGGGTAAGHCHGVRFEGGEDGGSGQLGRWRGGGAKAGAGALHSREPYQPERVVLRVQRLPRPSQAGGADQ